MFFCFFFNMKTQPVPSLGSNVLFYWTTTTACHCAVGVADLHCILDVLSVDHPNLLVEPSHAVSEEGGSSLLKLSLSINSVFPLLSQQKNNKLHHSKEETMNISAACEKTRSVVGDNGLDQRWSGGHYFQIVSPKVA